jgi:hypothetical protein
MIIIIMSIKISKPQVEICKVEKIDKNTKIPLETKVECDDVLILNMQILFYKE